MKKKSREQKSDELRLECDLEELVTSGVQGKYAKRYQEGTNIVLLDGDVAEALPNDETVNEALRLVIKFTKMPKSIEKLT
jgi:hypothetical protein